MARGGGGAPRAVPATLGAMMDLASKDPAEFTRIIEENPRLLEQLERKAASTTTSGSSGVRLPPSSRQGGAAGAAEDPRRALDPRRADPRRDPRRQRK
ncbi:unnamed protein product [Ectocarpus sp. 13 AM-2016]